MGQKRVSSREPIVSIITQSTIDRLVASLKDRSFLLEWAAQHPKSGGKARFCQSGEV